MACRTGCPTQDHESWGACLRAANIRVGQVDATRQKRWDQEIETYRSARQHGIQPAGTSLAQTRAALDASDRSGRPYDASRGF